MTVFMHTAAGALIGAMSGMRLSAGLEDSPALALTTIGLLAAAVRDPDPVMFFEHKAMYRSISGAVPEQPYSIPFGKARVVREGGPRSCP